MKPTWIESALAGLENVIDNFLTGRLRIVRVAVESMHGRFADHADKQALLAGSTFDAKAARVTYWIHFIVDTNQIDRIDGYNMID